MMNGQRMIVEADSASTVQELAHQICHKAGLQDSSGFSIYITLMQRVRHLPHLFFYFLCLDLQEATSVGTELFPSINLFRRHVPRILAEIIVIHNIYTCSY